MRGDYLSVAENAESGKTLARKLDRADLLAALTGCLSDDAFLMFVFLTGGLGISLIYWCTCTLRLLIYITCLDHTKSLLVAVMKGCSMRQAKTSVIPAGIDLIPNVYSTTDTFTPKKC